jgi:hypothetical protein
VTAGGTGADDSATQNQVTPGCFTITVAGPAPTTVNSVCTSTRCDRARDSAGLLHGTSRSI